MGNVDVEDGEVEGAEVGMTGVVGTMIISHTMEPVEDVVPFSGHGKHDVDAATAVYVFNGHAVQDAIAHDDDEDDDEEEAVHEEKEPAGQGEGG